MHIDDLAKLITLQQSLHPDSAEIRIVDPDGLEFDIKKIEWHDDVESFAIEVEQAEEEIFDQPSDEYDESDVEEEAPSDAPVVTEGSTQSVE